MTKAEEMVRKAQAAQEQKAGVRMKARINDALWSRVKRCAEAACMAAEEWVNLACRAWQAGRFNGVPFDEKQLLVTRENSAPQWVRVPQDMDGRMLKTALLQAVIWHEPKIRPVTPQKGTEGWVEGKDYVIGER